MFRDSDTETDSISLNYEWSLRAAPPRLVIHVCGPAYSSPCSTVGGESSRSARCDRCGAQIGFSALARMIRRAEEQPQ
jgi:hypothetical protein